MGLSGVEPLTSRLSGVRSNHLSYRPYCPVTPNRAAAPSWAETPRPLRRRTRRPDRRIRRGRPAPPRQARPPPARRRSPRPGPCPLEVLELLVVETVAATLERPVRRLTGQHSH